MTMPKISIRALRAFIAVYEEQSFSRAAKRENATQSGMSTQVRNLELRLDADLLVRQRKKFALTPAGQIVYAEGQAILKRLIAIEKTVEEMGSAPAGLVRFGMIPTLTRSVLGAALEGFRQDASGVELSLVEEYSGSLLNRVMAGEIEFAVVPAGELPAGLTARFIGRDHEMLLSAPGQLAGFAHMAQVPLGALEGQRLIVPSAQNVRRNRIEAALKAHGVHLADMMEMDGMLATIEIIAQSHWVAILPSAICHADRGGAARWLNPICDPPMTLDYVIVQKAEMTLSRAARLLADRIAQSTADIIADWTNTATSPAG